MQTEGRQEKHRKQNNVDAKSDQDKIGNEKELQDEEDVKKYTISDVRGIIRTSAWGEGR